MLGGRIEDDIESQSGIAEGLGLLPVSTEFAADKILRRRTGTCAWLATEASGYEIRHGRVTRSGGDGLLVSADGEPDGCRVGSLIGTSWHGALEHDGFRRALLAEVADACGRTFTPGTTSFAAARAARLDVLGDLVEHHLDTTYLEALIDGGPSADLGTVQTEVRPCFAS